MADEIMSSINDTMSSDTMPAMDMASALDVTNLAIGALNEFFLVMMGMVVFLMQMGFAFLEAGSVRSKNTVNILLKNLLEAAFACVSYWAVGWAFSNGDASGNNFIGTDQFFFDGVSKSAGGAGDYAAAFFQFCFAATASTIVSGAVAERTQFGAYFIYTTVLTGFVYPIVACWCWNGEGWAAKWGYSDFAGSGIVHVCGGTAAFVGAALLGPRQGRFDPETGATNPIPGHSMVLTALGGFTLWFGFLAFNGGSVLGLVSQNDEGEFSSSGAPFGNAIITTMLAGSGGAITALVLERATGNKKWTLSVSINGALAGMVAICAGAASVEPWASLIIGAIGACCYYGFSALCLKLKVDDPLDASAVHFGAGFWGTMAVPIFATEGSILYDGDFELFGKHLVVLLAIISWTASIIGGTFFALSKAGLFRVDPEVETAGLDVIKHGEHAYVFLPTDFDREIRGMVGPWQGIKSTIASDTKIELAAAV